MKIRLLLFASVLLFAAGAVALAGQVSRHAIGPTSDALATNHQPGGFDNSADNPANPDPTREVPFGEQTWDEMMIGFFNWIKH